MPNEQFQHYDCGDLIERDKATRFITKRVEIMEKLQKHLVPLLRVFGSSTTREEDVPFFSSNANGFLFSKGLIEDLFKQSCQDETSPDALLVVLAAAFDDENNYGAKQHLLNPTVVLVPCKVIQSEKGEKTIQTTKAPNHVGETPPKQVVAEITFNNDLIIKLLDMNTTESK